MDFLSKPIGLILKFFSDLTGGNFALAVLLFTILVNLLLLPLSIKSQKSNAGQTRIKPKVDALRKKYGDDKTRFNTELSRLYQEEKISTAGGCLPMVIRMIFIMAIYYCVTRPLSIILRISSDVINNAVTALANQGITAQANYNELTILNNLDKLGDAGAGIVDKAQTLNFNLFGLDLTQKPEFSLNIFGDFQWIWLIPILSFVTAMLTSILSMRMQKKVNPDAPNMAAMMLTMPLISLWIAFTVPGAVGLYWIYSNLIMGGIQLIVSHIYSPYKIIANDHAKAAMKRKADEKLRIARAASHEAEENNA